MTTARDMTTADGVQVVEIQLTVTRDELQSIVGEECRALVPGPDGEPVRGEIEPDMNCPVCRMWTEWKETGCFTFGMPREYFIMLASRGCDEMEWFDHQPEPEKDEDEDTSPIELEIDEAMIEDMKQADEFGRRLAERLAQVLGDFPEQIPFED